MKIRIMVWSGLMLIIGTKLLSEPAYNGSSAGCGGGRCHSYESGSVNAKFIGDNQIQVTVSGTSANIGAELVDASNHVVDSIESTSCNPCILTAPGPGDYQVNAGYAGPLKYGAASLSALPVELSNFEALIINNKVRLFWRTCSETNNYGFEVQIFDLKQKKWQSLAFLAGNGTTMEPKEYSFSDQTLRPCGIYRYRLKQIDTTGMTAFSKEATVKIKHPNQFELKQNYPNPFNAKTIIQFTISENTWTRLNIYNCEGKLIDTPMNKNLNAGGYSIVWDANHLPSGVYMYTLETRRFQETKKFVLIR
jgi:hypothetical protein